MNQFDNDIDINFVVVEWMVFVYNKEFFFKVWYFKRDCNVVNEYFDNGDIYVNFFVNKWLCCGSYICCLF